MTAIELETKGDEKMATGDYTGAETAYLDALAKAKKKSRDDRKKYNEIMNKYCEAVDTMIAMKESRK